MEKRQLGRRKQRTGWKGEKNEGKKRTHGEGKVRWKEDRKGRK